MLLTKSEDYMERLEFNDIADLGNLLYELATEEESVVTAVLFYDEAQELLRWLMQYEDVDIGHIDFKHEDYGYDGEYYITLDTDLFLDVKPVKKNSNYTCIDTDALFLDGDANSKIAVINADFEFDASRGLCENDCKGEKRFVYCETRLSKGVHYEQSRLVYALCDWFHTGDFPSCCNKDASGGNR